jgi:dTDP-4-amino-4,6-dideoxygalactose transaminase
MIPLADLKSQIAPIRAELDAAIKAVIDDAAFILGPAVEHFERAFASHVGVKHCVGVSSGTAALQLALLARGIGPGDEVVTTPMSFFATAEAISLTGATPVFADVEADTLNIDPARIEAAITPRTRAILPVHLFGQAASMGPILEIARRRGLDVVEDACQSHGATYGERKLGSLGVAGCFSFYPGKNLGAFGEGGAIVTSDDALAAKARELRDHGSPEKNRHTRVGYNYRLDGIQGAVLGVKLRYLEGWNEARRALAARYRQLLAGLAGVEPLAERAHGRHVYHLFVVRSARRGRIFEAFAERDIARAVHYPVPVHLQEAYAGLGQRRGSLPVSERAADEVLSLPVYPELSHAQQDEVVDAIASTL